MSSRNTVLKGRHCAYDMHVHLVFVTKYRKPVLTKVVLQHLESLFQTICEESEAILTEFNGEEDHVHLLIHYPPKIAVAQLVNRLKGTSSRAIRLKRYPSITQNLWGESLWSPSYFSGSCGGAPIDIVRKYIESQASPKS